MATKTSGWLCTHTAKITDSTDATVTITVTCYWKNNGWAYDIKHVSAWVYCNGTSKQVKTDGDVDSRGDNYKSVSCGSYAFTIPKTTAAQSISCYAKITSDSSYVSGTKSSTAANVSVPAKTSYAVKYNANGGTGAPSSQTKWYGTALTLSSTKPSRTGYYFQGWGTTATDTSVNYAAGASYTANAAITLYAIWKANTYTVKYDANGGSDAPASQTKTYGVNLTLSTTKPTRPNYNFLGWGTSKTSTTVSHVPGSIYTKNSEATLYAVWELAYIKPRITNDTISRCRTTNDGTEAVDDGTSAQISFDWATDKEVTSITIEWKLSSATEYTNSEPITASGTSGHVSKIIGSDDATNASALSTENTYNFRITVTDSESLTVTDSESSYALLSLPGMIFPIDVLAKGKGVSFGKPAELDGVADIGYETRFYGGIRHMVLEPETDLNEVITPNTYIGANVTSNAYVNCPFTNGTFTLTVDGAGEEGQVRQRIQFCSKNRPHDYERFYYQKKWGEWRESSYKSAITVGLTSNVTLGVLNTYTQIPFNTSISSQGLGLTLTDNCVKIGVGVHKINVSAMLRINTGTTSSASRHIRLRRLRNGTETSLAWNTMYLEKSTSTSSARCEMMCIPPIIVDVEEGDLLYIVFYTPDVGDVNRSGSSTNGYETYMTVESL